MVPDNPGLKYWSDLVRLGAETVMGEREPLDDAVSAKVTFYMPRPKTVIRKYPTPKPDLDKLQRAVFDSLTGVCYHDDCQVISVQAQKLYADEEHPPGVELTIERFP